MTLPGCVPAVVWSCPVFPLSCSAVLLSCVPAVVQCWCVPGSWSSGSVPSTLLERPLHSRTRSGFFLCAVRTGTFCTCCSLASLAVASVLLGLFRAASSLKTVQGKSDRDVRPQVKRLLEPKERSDFQLPRGGLIKPETKTAFSIRAAIVQTTFSEIFSLLLWTCI